jgi:hypothetical protein
MELLETQDPEKKKLLETSDRHKRELEKEVKVISDNTQRVLKNALIIGGALAITYLIVSQASSKRKKKKEKNKLEAGLSNIELREEPSYSPPTFFSQLKERIISEATIILLDLAKEKLNEYISSQKASNEGSQSSGGI